MSKSDHNMIRAALATKKRYGSVTLTEEQIATIETISGQRIEKTWLGQNNSEEYPLELDENGDFKILKIIAEEEKLEQSERHQNSENKK